MRRQTSWKLSRMKQDEKFSDVDWKMLNEYLPHKLLEELDEENNTTIHRQLSTNTDHDLPTSSNRNNHTQYELQTIPTVYQTDSLPVTPRIRNKHHNDEDILLSIVNIRNPNDEDEDDC
ncbi:unnamed protein product, partial [Adineta steineri]